MELLERIAAHASDRGSAIAIRQADAPPDAPPSARILTYAQLQAQVTALAGKLRHLLPHGAVVMLLCSNRPEFWLSYFAVLAADLSIFPISADIVAAELQVIAERSGAAGIICEDRLADTAMSCFPLLAEMPEVGAEMRMFRAGGDRAVQPGAGLLLQSSGTTGNAKIVWRSGLALDHMARNMHQRIGFSPEDRVLTGMPLSHSYGGEHGVLAPAFGGASVHVCSGVKLPVIAHELRESGITMLPGVPFLFEIMGQASEEIGRLNHLRFAISAGAQLPQVVYDAFTRRFGLPIAQIYGATELGSVTFNDPSRTGFDPQSVGLPLPGVDIRIVRPGTGEIAHPLPAGHEGEVAVKACTMLAHLIGEHSGQFAGGYVLTGDLGRLDSYGALTITGRLRLLIDVGGRKVNPIEVEQVICAHPSVRECVVVPMNVSHTVARLKAVVVPRGEGTADMGESIRTFARERLSAYKVPRMVEFRESLPRTALGKILRHLVEEQT